jgi:serine/threonine-protein kinase HipA
MLDPDLFLYRGRQYTPLDKNLFGLFSDSCPDRWGRLLMQRREAIIARKENRKPTKLNESDYLLGVYDEARMGALRFRLIKDGPFESSDESFATPPWVSLRKLESASIAFENDETGLEEKWLNQLLAPGSSLGGARPKATVQDVDGSLWIAKFPSRHDDYNSGAWEMTVHELAKLCGLNVPKARLETFSSNGSTFITKRFDRNDKQRIHFSSAMTLLGQIDGQDSSGYLDIVSFIKSNGSRPETDLIELWKRIIFNMAVTNSDDHLRNHGFLLTENGWQLSPLYDVNPVPYGDTLSLNVSEDDNSIDLELAIETAIFYGISKNEAEEIAKFILTTVRDNWEILAKKYGLSRSAMRFMEPAFNLCYE